MSGIIGKKGDMTRIVKGDKMVPVTLISIPKISVAQVKTIETDGYQAIVLEVNEGKNAFRREVSMTEKMTDLKKGDEVSVELLEGIDMISITGISKGKGFAGAMKRHNFSGGPGRVGSKFHRALGSIGTRKPRRTKPGKKMHGHMGNEQVTINNVPVEIVLKERSVIGVRGPVPGARNAYLVLQF